MKITDTHIYFWDGNGIYSNWYPASFVDPITKIQYQNSEQAYMWYKANRFGDINSQNLIEATPDPEKVKALGKQVLNFDKKLWGEVKFELMIGVNEFKFTQNAELGRELLQSGNKILVEASPFDCVWGVGLGENDPLILDEKNWKGQNLLGKALMKVREALTFLPLTAR